MGSLAKARSFSSKGSIKLKTETLRTLTAFVLLVLIGVAGRFLFLDLPNFTATAGVAVFAGFYFAKRSWAILAPLSVMIISNLWLDAYTSWGELIVVYAAMVFPVFLSRSLRSSHAARNRMSLVGVGTCAIVPSIVFFVSTNFAVWLFNGYYTSDMSGLATCYLNAVPFYRFTLAGDAVFVVGAFVAYELAVHFAPQRGRIAALES